jgi:hypothetical protein
MDQLLLADEGRISVFDSISDDVNIFSPDCDADADADCDADAHDVRTDRLNFSDLFFDQGPVL